MYVGTFIITSIYGIILVTDIVQSRRLCFINASDSDSTTQQHEVCSTRTLMMSVRNNEPCPAFNFSTWPTSRSKLQDFDCTKNLQTESLLTCILHNQRDATYTVFFIIISALRVSGGFSAHHQELIKLYVQPWVLSCFPAVYRWCGWGGTVQRQTAGKHDNNQGCTYSFISSWWWEDNRPKHAERW